MTFQAKLIPIMSFSPKANLIKCMNECDKRIPNDLHHFNAIYLLCAIKIKNVYWHLNLLPLYIYDFHFCTLCTRRFMISFHFISFLNRLLFEMALFPKRFFVVKIYNGKLQSVRWVNGSLTIINVFAQHYPNKNVGSFGINNPFSLTSTPGSTWRKDKIKCNRQIQFEILSTANISSAYMYLWYVNWKKE